MNVDTADDATFQNVTWIPATWPSTGLMKIWTPGNLADASRFSLVVAGDLTAASFLLHAAAFFTSHGLRVERVLTDQGSAYRSRAFAAAADQLAIQRRQTRPYRPQTNGKAERFIRTLTEEWAYTRLYTDNTARLAELPRWLDFYNRHRPHTALGGKPPAARLINNGEENYT